MKSRLDSGSMDSARRTTVLRLCLFCMTVMAARAAIQAPPSSTIEQRFQVALATEDRGDLEGAKRLLIELRRESPGVFAIDESLGLIDVAQGRIDEALPLLEAAVREQPASDAAHANLGGALFKLHRNNEALREFEQAARINPKSVIAQQSLGELWLDAGKPDRATEAYAAALRLKPGDEELTFSYAAALVAGKRYEEAAWALTSPATAGQSALAQSLLGEIDEQKGSFESAAQHLTRAVELDPSEENMWALGVEFLRHWTFEAAVKEFAAGRDRYPSSMRMRFGLGAAYFGNGAYARAIPEFSELLKSAPDNAMYAQMLGLSCTAVMRESSPQCALLVSYANAHPQDAENATHAANWLLTDANATQAERLLRTAISRRPDLADAQYGMGVLKQNELDWQGSVGYLERAVALKPEDAQAHYHLALAYWRTGHRADGQREMELHRKYASQEKEQLDQRLRQITTFVVNYR